MVLEIKELGFRYKTSKEDVIKDMSLEIPLGQIIGILGDSGCGKSTLLRLIAGLETPYTGSIQLDGKTLVNRKQFIQPEKRGIGMVFQDYALFPHMTIAKNIGFGLTCKGREKKDRIHQMLNLVELEGYGNRYPHELSGGQQQRVALARALAPMPLVLLLDEPFSNLDASLKEGIRKRLKVILQKTGVTTIFVTHDQGDVKAIADQVVLVKDGQVDKQGKVTDILA